MWRIVLAALLFAVPLTALAHDDEHGIDVIDVSGPLDASALEFMANSIEAAAGAGQELAVLQINSKAVLDRDGYERLAETVRTPPIPVAVWIGPAPSAAFGGAALIAWEAEQAAIAPGSEVAPWEPLVLGEAADEVVTGHEPLSAEQSGLELQPTLRQYLQDLDGRTFPTTGGPVSVSTITEFGDGVTLKPVTFRKPGLATRFFRLAVTPEAAFLFLVAGLTVITFELFALGPGVAAGVASVSLVLAGWGIVTLPVRWWALGLAVGGWILLTAGHQKGGMVVYTAVGAVLLQLAGMNYVAGGGQIDPRWWLVLPSVLAFLFFFVIAMPTVQRARLSTPSIGRDRLVGHTGRALVDFDPDGIVEVGGARWRATAHREAGLTAGSEIVVTSVDGLFLEVEGIAEDRET